MIELLRRQGFVEMPGARAASAVYLLLYFGEVVYVGKSTNIFSRIGNHWRGMERGRGKISHEFDCVAVDSLIRYDQVLVKFAKPSEIGNLEADLIKFYKPKHNRCKPTSLPNVSIDVVAIAREVGVEYINSSVGRTYRRRVA